MIRYLADTNILGYFTRHAYPSLHRRMLAAMQTDEVAISVVTRAETRFGQALLDANDKRQASINLLLNEIATLTWTAAAADRYGTVAAHLRKAGQPIGEMDALIAAHALAENLILVTHNTGHFSRVPGLQLDDWTNCAP